VDPRVALAQTASVWMTLSILAWAVFWLALDTWSHGRLAERAELAPALWLAPVLSLAALLFRLSQAGFRPWWRLAERERVDRLVRAALLFSALGALLVGIFEPGRELQEGAQPLWLRILLHAGILLVLLWIVLPYSTLLDQGDPEEADRGS
jgi:hypothetical protein